ncbi:MAG TPA: methyltransferase domain-containing protein [Gaiellaceae bacterium]|nr:methyltransferase domain-containing protein [Gaiellaceae bacterium]
MSVWDERAERYRTSAVHANGPDLDVVVEMCNPGPGVKALDVATGGGHVARRLREAGAEVVTVDPSPGMQPDVIAPAEQLPFADGSFDVVVTRLAAHHFQSIGDAIGEIARVSNGVVVIEDHHYTDEETEQAEKLRDPSHVRSLSEEEWRELLVSAALEVERVEFYDMTLTFDDWLARTDSPEAARPRIRELLAPLSSADGTTWTSPMIMIKARKSQR